MFGPLWPCAGAFCGTLTFVWPDGAGAVLGEPENRAGPPKKKNSAMIAINRTNIIPTIIPVAVPDPVSWSTRSTVWVCSANALFLSLTVDDDSSFLVVDGYLNSRDGQ
jgi:hypothetical protein